MKALILQGKGFCAEECMYYSRDIYATKKVKIYWHDNPIEQQQNTIYCHVKFMTY